MARHLAQPASHNLEEQHAEAIETMRVYLTDTWPTLRTQVDAVRAMSLGKHGHLPHRTLIQNVAARREFFRQNGVTP
jgi:hypothetical protein